MLTSQSIAWNHSIKTNVPKIVLDTIKAFITANIPELIGSDILITKICWDSFALDLDFVIDWVPEIKNCMVVTGGSGHGMPPSNLDYITSSLCLCLRVQISSHPR